ncbi:hypothetical protein K0M31_013887 [Melipona bicolor]|uniref:Uncharacterized protein n=1 Tax=Melipona bicolor TaxID=60889 RepID=A0AA40G7G6_9HYME|nr:hypothetical protein K0M31_013887 [Melipona bicolor]
MVLDSAKNIAGSDLSGISNSTNKSTKFTSLSGVNEYYCPSSLATMATQQTNNAFEGGVIPKRRKPSAGIIPARCWLMTCCLCRKNLAEDRSREGKNRANRQRETGQKKRETSSDKKRREKRKKKKKEKKKKKKKKKKKAKGKGWRRKKEEVVAPSSKSHFPCRVALLKSSKIPRRVGQRWSVLNANLPAIYCSVESRKSNLNNVGNGKASIVPCLEMN